MTDKNIITGVEIKGFQSWLTCLVYFGSGVNVLSGNSHEGKSAFLRALMWALQNNVKGGFDNFKHWKLKPSASVFTDIQFSDDQWVSREQSKKFNRYYLPNTEKPLAALRTDLPAEVSRIIRMNEINFQRQKTWFLLDKSPSQVAKSFNELVNLGILDAAISECNSRIRSQNRELVKLSEREETLKDKTERNAQLINTAEKEFEKIYQLDLSIHQSIEEYNRILGILQNANKIMAYLKVYEGVEQAMFEANELRKLQNDIQDLTDQHYFVQESITDIDKMSLQIKKLERTSIALKELGSIEQLDRESLSTLSEMHKVHDLTDQIENITIRIKNLAGEISVMEKSKQNMFREMGICPYCQSEIA